jgi:phosphatidylglycerophosphatase A
MESNCSTQLFDLIVYDEIISILLCVYFENVRWHMGYKGLKLYPTYQQHKRQSINTLYEVLKQKKLYKMDKLSLWYMLAKYISIGTYFSAL